MKVTLASASPRRRQLIKQIDGIDVDVVPSNCDEQIEMCQPAIYAARLAEIKAYDVFGKVGGLVIGADTIVVADNKILGKPHSPEEARDMFALLCGKTHEVITGFCVVFEDGERVMGAEHTFVTFAAYDEGIVEKYIATGSPFDKAGGYGIQDEMLSPLIVGIDGDYDNVVGFPVEAIAAILHKQRS